jgi:dihydroorotate dehydrogenase (fumarate)
MGLPNYGLDYYVKCSEELGRQKPYFISICGLSREENLQMLSNLEHDELVQEMPVAGVELNLSCPNVHGKPQTCYDFDAMDETLRQTFEMFTRLPLGVKLSPYFDPIHFDMAYDVLKDYPKLRWVTCINSIGNGLVVDPIREQTIIHPKNGMGGIGGQAVKATALSNVWNFRQRLSQDVDVIGCGGVNRGLDVFEHILCGASAVQIGTLVRDHGVDAFRLVTEDLVRTMNIKGYSSLDDFRGNLKTVSPSTN